MKILLVDPMRNVSSKSFFGSDPIPRIGDEIDFGFEPFPEVAKVIWFPKEKLLDKMGFSGVKEIKAIIICS